MINIGSNKFENCAIPLVFEDRYFLVEYIDGNDAFTVFTIIKGNPIIEILRNEPQRNSLTDVEKNQAGILTVSDSKNKEFLYKIRPASKNSSIFGLIKGEEREIKIKDNRIEYLGSVFSNNIFYNVPVGIKINKDGSVALGVSLSPDFIKLISK